MPTFIIIFISLLTLSSASDISENFTTTKAYVPPRFKRRIGCAYGKHCLIDCTPAADGLKPCVHAWIFGVNAKSLTVICNHSSSVCESAFINCPMHSDAHCNIKCGNHNVKSVVNGTTSGQCQNMEIQTMVFPQTGSLQLECEGTHACKDMNVFCPSNKKNNCHIDCKSYNDAYGASYGACSGMKINAEHNHSRYTDYLELKCDTDECDGVQFHCWDEETIEHNITKQSNLTYNERKSQYECDGDQCCPLSVARSVSLRGYIDKDANGSDVVMISVVVLIVASVILVGLFAAYCAFKAKKMQNEDVYYLSP